MSAISFIAAGAILYQIFSDIERDDPGAHVERMAATVSYAIGAIALISGLGHVYLASESSS